MKQCLQQLDQLIGDTKTLDKSSFEKRYSGNSVDIPVPKPVIIDETMSFFRGRLAEDVGQSEDLSNPATFSYVPLALNKKGLPKMGRLNYKGQSIFYASLHMRTNFKEISKDCSIGDEVYMAKWVLKPQSGLHLYKTIPQWGLNVLNDPNNIFTIIDPNIINSDWGLCLKRIGYIMMSNEEIGKYLGYSYIANCIYDINGIGRDNEGNKYELYYDGIVYPSAVGDDSDINIALKPDFVDRNLSLECVIKGTLAPDGRNVEFRQIGINEGGRIVWYEPYVDENSITDVVPKSLSPTNSVVDVSRGNITDANGQRIKTVMTPIQYIFTNYRDQILNKLFEFVRPRITETQTICKKSLEGSKRMAIINDLQGWHLVEGSHNTPLSKVVYEITVSCQLRQTE